MDPDPTCRQTGDRPRGMAQYTGAEAIPIEVRDQIRHIAFRTPRHRPREDVGHLDHTPPRVQGEASLQEPCTIWETGDQECLVPTDILRPAQNPPDLPHPRIP